MELTLLCLDEDRVLKKLLEDRLNVVDVLLRGLGEDQDVVKIDQDLATCADKVLVVDRRRVEGRLPLFHECKKVGVPEVQLGEDLGPLKELKSRRGHETQRVPVKPPVVDAGTHEE